MALPASVTTVPVHIKILAANGAPATGRVVFSGAYGLRDTTGKIVVGQPYVVATLDANGESTVNLIATNDPDLNPVNWGWNVSVETNVWAELFVIQIPYTTVGILEFSDITPAIIAPITSPYSLDTILAFSQAGVVTNSVGAARIYNDSGRVLTIRGVRASVGSAPTGSSLVVDVKKNGVTIFTNIANRPTIPAGTNTSGKVTAVDTPTFNIGDYFTSDVVQIGATLPGSDLTVQIWLS